MSSLVHPQALRRPQHGGIGAVVAGMDHKIISEFESWNALVTMSNLQRPQSFLTAAAPPSQSCPQLRWFSVSLSVDIE